MEKRAGQADENKAATERDTPKEREMVCVKAIKEAKAIKRLEPRRKRKRSECDIKTALGCLWMYK